jgi:hypothetical protein
MRTSNESGIALISALLVTMLMAAVLVGFAAVVASDNRLRGLDDSRSEAFYAAHAGLEKLTADLGDLFAANFAPTAAQLNTLTAAAPVLPEVQWLAPDGTPGYRIVFPPGADGNPVADVRTIHSGPWQGFVGLLTPYTLTVTARMSDRSEASLTRTLQTVSIPVFQFGTFSQTDLSFFAGVNFNFGGRVHTNQSLFLASGNGVTLTLGDRVTAVGEIIRTNLSNGWNTNNNYTGTVNMIKSTNSFRALARTEGSLVGTVPSAQNEPTWTNLSTATYNHNIMNGRTGARTLNLPIVAFGAQPIDLIHRPLVNENNLNPQVYSQRYYTQVSLRILLSDNAADIMNLPGVTATQPVPLGNLAVTPIGGYVVNANNPPLAISVGTAGPNCSAAGDCVPAGTPLTGGFLKIEMQDMANTWTDVTLEILNLGLAGRNIGPGQACAEPNPNAVIRIQRLKDTTAPAACGNNSVVATDYWPNVLYDAREGAYRDNVGFPVLPYLGGSMHYIEIDARNLSRWFQGVIGASGANANNVTGYSIYFSDRRGNHDPGLGGAETGEYGFEDVVNAAVANGTPDGGLDVGEDVNGNNQLDTYGQVPQVLPAGIVAPLNVNARPWTTVAVAQARRNPAVLFRRSLKLTNGTLGNIVAPGLTVVSENPVYVQGNWNANNAGFGNPHVATAVIADSVTLLSNAWNDLTSWNSPHDRNPRNGQTTWYRLAIIAGKPLSFPLPGGVGQQDFGTDGGAHNFLRYIEDWGGFTLNYRGAIATLYTSRQGVGTYKCCATVYQPPTRGFNFDTDFLQPALLPPRTPMFRDVNSLGFNYVIRPR